MIAHLWRVLVIIVTKIDSQVLVPVTGSAMTGREAVLVMAIIAVREGKVVERGAKK